MESAQRTHERIIIAKNGRPADLLMSVQDHEGLLETLDVLGDPDALRQLRESEQAIDDGDLVRLAQVQAELEARRGSSGSRRRAPRGDEQRWGRRRREWRVVSYEVVVTGPARRALSRMLLGPASAVLELLAGPLAATRTGWASRSSSSWPVCTPRDAVTTGSCTRSTTGGGA